MKKLIYSIFCAAIIISCGSNAGKFEGKWRPMTFKTFPVNAVLTIQKQGEHYIAINSVQPERPVELVYNDSTKTLSGNAGMNFQIQYMPETGHILLSPSMAPPTEFEKSDD